MIGLITLRRDAVLTPDPEPSELSPSADAPEPIPEVVDQDGRPLGWSIREVRGLRFARWRAQRGDFDGDLVGPRPENVPTIDPIDNGRNDR